MRSGGALTRGPAAGGCGWRDRAAASACGPGPRPSRAPDRATAASGRRGSWPERCRSLARARRGRAPARRAARRARLARCSARVLGAERVRCERVYAKYRVGDSLRVGYRIESPLGCHHVAARTFPDGASAAAYRRAVAAAVPAGAAAAASCTPASSARCSGRSPTTAGSPGCRCWPAARRRSTRSSAMPACAPRLVAYAPERSASAECRDAAGRVVAYAKVHAEGGAERERAQRRARRRRARRGRSRPSRAARPGRLGARGALVLEAARRAPARHAAPGELGAALAAHGRRARHPSRPASAAGRSASARLDPERLGARRRRDRARAARRRARRRRAAGAPAGPRRRRRRPRRAPARRRQPAQRARSTATAWRCSTSRTPPPGPAAADLGQVLAGLLLARVPAPLAARPRRELGDALLAGYARVRPPPAAALRWHTAASVLARAALPAVNRVRADALARLRGRCCSLAGGAAVTATALLALLPALGRARAPDALLRAVRRARRALPRRAAVRRAGAGRDPAARRRRDRRRCRRSASAPSGAFVSHDPRYTLEQAWAERARADARDAASASRPAVVLVELFPFGRAKFARELVPLLEAGARGAARSPPAACATSSSAAAPNQQRFDDRAAGWPTRTSTRCSCTATRASPASRRRSRPATPLRVPVRYTGFVVRDPASAARDPARRPGRRLGRRRAGRRAAAERGDRRQRRLRRRADAPDRRPDAAGRRLRAAARRRRAARRARARCARCPTSAPSWRGAAASVSQGGYNTALEVAALARAGAGRPLRDRRGGRADAPRPPAAAPRRAAGARPRAARRRPCWRARSSGCADFVPARGGDRPRRRALERAHPLSELTARWRRPPHDPRRPHAAPLRAPASGARWPAPAPRPRVLTAADLAKPWPLALVVDRVLAERTAPFALDGGDMRLLAAVAGARAA